MGNFAIAPMTPGGNIKVLRQGDFFARLANELRDTEGDWFYSAFAVDFTATGDYDFSFDHPDRIGSQGMSCSTDGGLSWHWTGAAGVDDKHQSFRYHVDRPHRAMFTIGIPYFESDWRRFLSEFSLQDQTLCLTQRQGRPLPFLRFGNPEAPDKILLTAHHHACEMTAGHALEGVLRYFLQNKSNFEVFAVPFVDLDGVMDGDQGKNRRPHDHNRDYIDQPVYREVAAIQSLVTHHRINYFLDFHCPCLRGEINEIIYLPLPKVPVMAERAALFSQYLVGAVPQLFDPKDNIPYGVDWHCDRNYAQGRTSNQWAERQPYMKFAAIVEIPYANARTVVFDRATMLQLGAAIGQALTQVQSTLA